jgi:LacI family transcriptional regulator
MQVRRQQQRVGMQAVARRVNVATSSVSRVLSGHPDVSPEMRERVLAAVLELGYEPDFFAQSLRRGASMSIAFLVADISNPLLASIALGAEKVLRSVGYSMLLTNSGGDPELDLANIRLFIHRRVDGLILSLSSERKKAIVDLLAESQIPTVVVDRQLPPRACASAVFSCHAGRSERPVGPRTPSHRPGFRASGHPGGPDAPGSVARSGDGPRTTSGGSCPVC